MEQQEIEIRNPIRVKDLSFTMPEWLIIYNNTVHNNTVIADTLIRKDEDIKADYFHSVETNKRICMNRAADLSLSLLRQGIIITFLDDSINHIRKMSPPLYNKYYSTLQPKNKPAMAIQLPDEIKVKAAEYRDNTIFAKTADLYDAVLHGYSLSQEQLEQKEKEIERLNKLVELNFRQRVKNAGSTSEANIDKHWSQYKTENNL